MIIKPRFLARTVWLVRSKTIPYFRIGNRLRFDINEINKKFDKLQISIYMNNKEYNNMREIINDISVTYANKNAFIIKNFDKTYKYITFKQFAEDIRYLGTALLKKGLKGKKIAVIGKNRYEWAISYYAVVNGLGIVVPLDKGLPEQEIENSLILSGAEVIIFEEKNYEPIKKILDKKTTKLKTLILIY